MTASSLPRVLLPALVAAAALSGCSAPTGTARPPSTSTSTSTSTVAPSDLADRDIRDRLLPLERRYGARIGVAVLDTGTGRRPVHRGDERLAFASTDKTFIAAATLQSAADADLRTVVHNSKRNLLDCAPITPKHVDTGMSVCALIDAALRSGTATTRPPTSSSSGRAALTTSSGSSVHRRHDHLGRPGGTRAERRVPGDRRDTTTPMAFSRDLQQVLLGRAPTPARRSLLESTMRRNTTGAPYIRAGVPDSWTVADMTGSASYGARNDIAVVRPPGRAPLSSSSSRAGGFGTPTRRTRSSPMPRARSSAPSPDRRGTGGDPDSGALRLLSHGRGCSARRAH